MSAAAVMDPATSPVERWWRGHWPPVLTSLLAVTLVGIAAHSTAQAGWVPEAGRYAAGLGWGAACGAALALSRYRARFALAYSLTLSLTAAAEAAGRIFPPLADLPFIPTLWLDIHTRTLTLGDRASAWVNAFVSGAAVRDTGLFVFLAYGLLWQTAAWLMWSLLRRRQALAAVLPLAALLGLNNQLAGRLPGEYAVFLGVAVVVIGHLARQAALADWEHRAVDYAEAIDLDWEVVNVILALIIGLGVFGAARVGPPAAWQALADLFRSAQAQTADTAARLFADVNPPAAHTSLGSARLPDLDQIGRPLPQGDEAIMWVTLSDPAPPPPGAPEASPAPRHYWRSRVYGEYTGAGWQPVEAGDPWPLPAEPPAGRYVLRQQYQIAAPVGDELFAVNAPITASAGLRVVSLGLTADSVVSGAATDYAVTSWAAAVTGSALDQAGAAYPEALPAQYRQLPADLPPRVRDLAARIAGAAATPYTKALRVQDYLRANYPYQLDAPLPPAGADAVDFFLFDAPGGFCTYYASAMVVLLRAQGVPARVAAGFAMGEFDTARGAWRVPAGAAHAWVEVYFPAYGWVEFEPTPAQARPDYGALTAPEPEPPPRASVGAPAPDLRWGWVWGAGLLLAGLSAGWWYARRTRRGQAPAVRLYWQARAALADAHLSAPPSATPDEFLAACAPALQPRPALRAAVQQLTRLYTAMTYSPRAVSAAEVRAAAGLWRRAWRERWQVWWLSRWPRPPAPPTAPAKSGTDHRTPRR